ncbi:hemolysin family protein [Salibacter sp.]|uniref:hemolysin family protein n=1 Tax=Salibacter sp. TaxID=2010995 RepID=UPI0028700D1D|nr:hemolysin family protein [Salibacter sp.]MDR9399011.1 hemolysin family protein [Salibacter sp.]MDR9488197.1 hemolysin family protein [Salibacter sp.]
MDSSLYSTIIISVLSSAFFSGMEIAFVSANKLQIELAKKQGNLTARAYSSFMKSPSRFITTMLLGNNIALVVFGIAMGDLLEPVFYSFVSNSIIVLLLQTIFSTLVILITAEFLPKAIFQINPNKALAIFAPPVFLVYYIFFPVVTFVNMLSNFVLKYIMRVDPKDAPIRFGMIDLDHLVKEATSSIEDNDEIENEIQIFQNALDFSNLKARECMIPRTEIVAHEIGESVEDLTETFIDTGLSKVLIYRDSIDNIIGYVHSSELFKRPPEIKNILLPISVLPETMPANEVLELLIQQKRSVAVVVDEFGGTSGLLTMEDVVEEIFGDIEDEHDQEELVEIDLGQNRYRFAARLEVDYLNEQYKLDLPEDEDYETLAGYIIHLHESIPDEGEVIKDDNFEFKVLQNSGKKIELVEVKVKSFDD